MRKVFPLKFVLWVILLALVSCDNAQETEPSTIPVVKVSVSPKNLEMEIGDQEVLYVTVTPSDATNRNYSFSSNRPDVVAVSSDGVVEALAAGKAIVTVKTEDQGKKATCSIEVMEAMGVTTGEATHVSCRNALIAGKAKLPESTSSDLTVGVLYSTSSGVLVGAATMIQATQLDSAYNYIVTTDVLEPETEYFYRSYLSQNGEIIYGEVKSFKTLPVDSLIRTLDVTDIQPKEAVFNAYLNLADCVYETVDYGFELTAEGASTDTLRAVNLSDTAFSYMTDNLLKDQKYEYTAFVNLDGRTYKSETKTFRTTPIEASVTAETQYVSYYWAKISGTLSVESGGTFQKSAVLYYSNVHLSIKGLVATGTKVPLTLSPDGSFSVDLSSLSRNTYYYYVVVTYVDDVEFATRVQRFVTKEIQASLSVNSIGVDTHSAYITSRFALEDDAAFTKWLKIYFSTEYSTLNKLKSYGNWAYLKYQADGTYRIDLNDLIANTTYNCVVVAKVDDKEFTSDVLSFHTGVDAVAEAVDLGLSVMWATCNLGASKPEEYGGHYQWAGKEDVTDTSYDLCYENCPYHSGSDYSKGWTKYVVKSYLGIEDDKYWLDPEDDAAHYALGGKWRMPYKEEWEELEKNCKAYWVYDYNGTGVVGLVLTSKKEGYTDKSIFLPAAGIRKGTEFQEVNGTGNMEIGYYWSSTLSNSGYWAITGFVSGELIVHYNPRFYGLSIRPVLEK